ncbi:uncharacterized protein K02A2.6-like [Aethina tumida]|uniref:uncharacterized protein K02A2.6-like n=1 Tax=Aethina tumida TaxID=116153 RepID=UPI00096AFA96|nr:uncharacterized protein K02A2.6-like [Aethina tumida]
MDEIINNSSTVFEQRIGRVPKYTISIQLRKDVGPVYHKERNVPYALREKVEKELDDLEKDDENSSIIQTISTHRGTYRMNRLSFGIKTAPAEFNHILNQILTGLSKTHTLQEFDLHVNKDKCAFFQTKIDYLGYVIEHNTISKSPSKVRAIIDIPRSKNVDEIRQFLGMVMYYARFIPDTSTMTYPLRKKAKFQWSSSCEASFLKLKQEISSEQILIPYDPQLPILLACDASPTGIVGVLSHLIDGEEMPIAFTSRLPVAIGEGRGIDKSVEKLVKSCEASANVKKSPNKAPTHHWDPPTSNWNRIHIDYVAPFQGFNYLVVIDAKSKWTEIKHSRDAPSSSKTIEFFKEIFTTLGYPEVLVSDNTTIFKLIAPGYPATNSLAERNVQSLKNKLKAMSNEPTSMSTKLREILLMYRATPLAGGKSSAELYLGRQIRIKLDAIKPIKHQPNEPSTLYVRNLSVGEDVQVKFYEGNHVVWKFGKITNKFGKLHYQVLLDNGYSIKRHIDQIWTTLVKRKEVRFTDKTVPDNDKKEKNQQFAPDLQLPLYIPEEVQQPA